MTPSLIRHGPITGLYLISFSPPPITLWYAEQISCPLNFWLARFTVLPWYSHVASDDVAKHFAAATPKSRQLTYHISSVGSFASPVTLVFVKPPNSLSMKLSISVTRRRIVHF